MRHTSTLYLAACLLYSPLVQAALAQVTPSDAQIVQEVKNTFAHEDALQGRGNYIFPTVRNGVVSLDGNVTSKAAKVLASSEVGQIKGVKTVLNNLTVAEANSSGVQGRGAATAAEAGHPGGEASNVVKVVELAPHTIIPIRIDEEIDTKTAKVGDMFHGTVPTTVYQTNYPMLPAGTPVLGRVAEAKPAGRLVGFALLTLELVSIRLPVPNGEPENMGIVTAALSSKTNGRGTNTAEKTGGGAAVGGIIGAIAGGGRGAAIGAGSGAVLGAGANALAPGQQIDIKPETLLRFTTTEPLPVHIELRNGYPVAHPAASGRAVDLRTRPSAQE